MSDLLVNRYQLLHVIGQGGAGVTYLATDTQTGSKVAIKQFNVQASQEGTQSWEKEIEMLRSLQHPQIPKYLDHFHVKVMLVSRPCLVQEYVEGISLEEESKTHRYSVEEVLVLGAEVLQIQA